MSASTLPGPTEGNWKLSPTRIRTAVAGRAQQSPAPPPGQPSKERAESQDLPAVLVDDALHEAFGPAEIPDEPTFRVQRPREAPRAEAPAPARVGVPKPVGRKEPALKGWMLPVLILSAVAALMLGIALALWMFG